MNDFKEVNIMNNSCQYIDAHCPYQFCNEKDCPILAEYEENQMDFKSWVTDHKIDEIKMGADY